MGDYLQGKSTKGSGDGAEIKNINVSQEVDASAIAKAVLDALGDKMISGGGVNHQMRTGSGEEFVDNFDNQRSMEELAKTMIVQRGEKQSNFDDLGGVERHKKTDSDDTIDFLSNLD
jgi:hypothetical protein